MGTSQTAVHANLAGDHVSYLDDSALAMRILKTANASIAGPVLSPTCAIDRRPAVVDKSRGWRIDQEHIARDNGIWTGRGQDYDSILEHFVSFSTGMYRSPRLFVQAKHMSAETQATQRGENFLLHSR